MRVALVSGIYPPDIGGPATHVADLAAALRERGHYAIVITLGERGHGGMEPGVIRYPRAWPWPIRLVAVALWLIRKRAMYDVIYANGLHEAAIIGGKIARRPVALKIVGDPAWERGVRRGLTSESFDDFQKTKPLRLELKAMVAFRRWAAKQAGRIAVPSDYLRQVVVGWTDHRARIEIITNAVRAGARTPEALIGPKKEGLLISWVGRMVSHKRLDLLLEAVAMVEGVEFEIIGDGPGSDHVRALAVGLKVDKRVEFTGALSHDEVLLRLARADALVIASSYEGLPHVAVEALSCGTPVICSAAGGTTEVISHKRNGLIVEPATAKGFATAFESLIKDPALRERLKLGARESSNATFEYVAERVEKMLIDLTS